MAVCPECGFEERPPTNNWVSEFQEREETTFPLAGLVVCPDCDAVLGGVEQ